MGIVGIVGAACLSGGPAQAATVWSGPHIVFTKAAFADPAAPQNQDRLTPDVWVTRANTQAIYNAAQESAFVHNVSPLGTQWANGSAADWSSLSFADWETWANGAPLATIGRDAVMHLVAADVYLDVKFLSWASGGTSGGGFSYERSTPVPEPAAAALLTGVAATALGRRRRQATGAGIAPR